METFSKKLRILHATNPARSAEVEALVDTGALYSWIPADRLAALGYAPTARRAFVVATGQVIERGLCEVRVALDDETRTTICVFGDPGSTPLLGAYTLEGFALGVNPASRQLFPLPVLPAM